MATRILRCGGKYLTLGVDYEELAGPKFRVKNFGYIGDVFQVIDLGAGTVTDLTLTRQDATGDTGDRVEPVDAVQWDVSSVPPGKPSVILSFAGDLTTTNYYAEAASPASSVTTNTRSPSNTIIAPFAGNIVTASLALTVDNTNQVWVIYKNGSNLKNFLTPSTGQYQQLALTGASVSAGDEVTLAYGAGAAPGESRIDLLLEET